MYASKQKLCLTTSPLLMKEGLIMTQQNMFSEFARDCYVLLWRSRTFGRRFLNNRRPWRRT